MLIIAIRSVLAQTKPATEIIIVDDGSTDETVHVVKDISANSPVSIIYLYQENLGPAAARNYGIAKSSGTILAFLDSDDRWQKNKLEIQFKDMQSAPQYLISHTKEKWYRRGQHLNQKRIHQPQQGYIFEKCLQLCCVGMSTIMIRSEVFERYGNFDDSLKCCEDYDYWLRLSVHERFLLVDRQLTIKEGGRPDQVSSIFRMGMDRFRIHSIKNLLLDSSLTRDQREKAKLELKKKCHVYGNGCIKHGKAEEGNYYLSLIDNLCK